MRIMIMFAFLVEAGNAAIRDGKVERVFQGILEESPPISSLKGENAQDFSW
jgi:hypothetical protein